MTTADISHQSVRRSTFAGSLLLVAVIVFSRLSLASDAPLATQMHEQPDQGLQSSGQTSTETSQELQPESQPSELVLVAGATGGTGREVIRELLASGYRVRAFVRDAEEARASFGDEVEYAVGDARERETLEAALDGVDAVVSAIGAGGGGEPGNTPESVDYGGVMNMANAATGLRQFVLVSAAGVTHEEHVLNKMFNNVLKWKFKGEEALRVSGVPYTIIRPAGLDDGPGGQKEIVLVQGDDKAGVISRADLARICVAALGSADAINKTFEVIDGKPLSDDETANDFDSAFAALIADKSATPVASDEITDETL